MGWVFAKYSLSAWMGISLLFFCFLSSRKAVILTYLGWLFLPCVVMLEIHGLIKIDKGVACGLAILIGTLIFDSGRITRFRLKWFDLPMLLTCLAPLFSSLNNGLGMYDGLSESRDQFLLMGMHYLIGRLYFSDLQGMTQLAKGIFYAGLVYVPLCWIEIRLSPQLHQWVYGFMAHPRFDEELRFGGYRPMVFLTHGLVLGMFMCLVSLLGVWLWRTKVIKQVYGVPMAYVVVIVLVTTVLCKSTNAIMLCAAGVFLLFFTNRLWRIVLLAMLFAPPLYCLLRGTKSWDGQEMVQMSRELVGSDRAGSVQFRLDNEDMLADKALRRPVFGWGGWDRARVFDENGKDLTVTDGMWIIILGNNGLFGLCCWLLATMAPSAAFLRRFPAHFWKHPAVAGTAAFSIYFVLVGIDSLLNAEAFPFVLAAMGGVVGTTMPAFLARRRPVSRAQRSFTVVNGFNPVPAAPRRETIPNLVERLAPGDPDSLVARPALPQQPADAVPADHKAVTQ